MAPAPEETKEAQVVGAAEVGMTVRGKAQRSCSRLRGGRWRACPQVAISYIIAV